MIFQAVTTDGSTPRIYLRINRFFRTIRFELSNRPKRPFVLGLEGLEQRRKMHPPNGYKFLSLQGKGQASTWLGESEDGDEVVIKTLELQKISDWKGIELFEREMTVLRQLDHLSIPKFIDFVKDEFDGAKRWHIVQERIEGSTLDTNKKWSEVELHDLAKGMLETLVYLQSFSPPLLHRDIKPENIVHNSNQYALIDFGSVRYVVPSDLGGSTVVGTSGYMAPEQLMGRADMSSDLYGLGMTLVHLISRKHPDDLSKKRMVVQWVGFQKGLSKDFINFVNTLTEPHAENRFKNALEALEKLTEPSGPSTSLIRKSKSWMRIKTKNNAVIVKGNRFVRHEFKSGNMLNAIYLIGGIVFIGLLPALVGSNIWLTPLIWFALIIFTFFLFVKTESIYAKMYYTEKGLEIEGELDSKQLPKSIQRELDSALDALSVQYSSDAGRTQNKIEVEKES